MELISTVLFVISVLASFTTAFHQSRGRDSDSRRLILGNMDQRFTTNPALMPKKAFFPDSATQATQLRPQYALPETDLQSAASDSGHHHGRVHIKVFRGPVDQHHHFAPHGYWVKHPEDQGHGY